MLESFSAAGFLVHTPFGPRKSGIPDSVEMPAPVSATTDAASRIQPAISSRATSSFPAAAIRCRVSGRTGRAGRGASLGNRRAPPGISGGHRQRRVALEALVGPQHALPAQDRRDAGAVQGVLDGGDVLAGG